MSEHTLPPAVAKLQTPALVVGVLGLAATLAGFFLGTREEFFRAYEIAFVYMIGFPLGCMAWLMIQYLSGGQWGLVGRRIFEASAMTMVLFVVLFGGVFVGMHDVFAWTHPIDPSDHVLQMKAPYLDQTKFLIRAVVYFALWIGFPYLIYNWARKQDEVRDFRYKKLIHNVSGLGLVVLSLSMTFAATDWIMSLEPHYYSTMLPVIWMAGNLLTGVAFTTIMLVILSKHEPLSKVLTKQHLHDFGNLMLAFTMFWAYCSFSQYLITWSGNLREETPWYLKRVFTSWGVVGGVLLAFHFFMPFFLLLFKSIKRNPQRLLPVAVWLLVMRYIDVYWQCAPAFQGHGEHADVHFIMGFMNITAPVGLFGLWFFFFIWWLRRSPLMPAFDPNLGALYHGK